MQNLENEGITALESGNNNTSEQARNALASDAFCQPTTCKTIPVPTGRPPSEQEPVPPKTPPQGPERSKPDPVDRPGPAPKPAEYKGDPCTPKEPQDSGPKKPPTGPNGSDIPPVPRPGDNRVPSTPIQRPDGREPRVIVCQENGTNLSKHDFPALTLVDDSSMKS